MMEKKMKKFRNVAGMVLLLWLSCILLSVMKVEAETGWYVTKGGYIAAVTEELLDHATSLVVSGDKVAFAKFIESNSYVFIMRDGLNVYVEKASLFSGKVRIRVKGMNISVWTAREALR